jgi:hypothetical protein
MLPTIMRKPFYRHDQLTHAVSYSCKLEGVPALVDIQRDSNSEIVLVYETIVEILADDGSLTGRKSNCNVGVDCNVWHYAGSIFTCDQEDPLPSTVQCWTGESQATPVCVQPGSNWGGALSGAIVSGLFALLFIVLSLTIERTFRNGRSDREVEVVGIIPGQPNVVRVTSPVIVGAPGAFPVKDVQVIYN